MLQKHMKYWVTKSLDRNMMIPFLQRKKHTSNKTLLTMINFKAVQSTGKKVHVKHMENGENLIPKIMTSFYDSNTENPKMKAEVPTTVDHVITVTFCVVALLIIYGVFRPDETSEKNVNVPSVVVKKLESGALITTSTVDPTEKDSVSKCET